MDKESVERLRFDRRLQRRPDWIEATDQEAYLVALPDVSGKMTTCAEEEKAAEEAASTAAAEEPAAVTTLTAAATAGDFSTPSPFGGFGSESGGN
jgi:hypothetical protein